MLTVSADTTWLDTRQTFPDEYYPLSEVTDEILDFAQQNVVRFRSYLVTDDVNDVIGKF